ncbi:MAG: hypothetical protein AB8F65_11530 [Woeseiaceae bacterium]
MSNENQATLLTQQILDAVDADDWVAAEQLTQHRDAWLRGRVDTWSPAELQLLIADDQRLSAGLSHRKSEVQSRISRIRTGQQAMAAYGDSTS